LGILVKTLYLLRHAKSSWDQPGLEDFARPLAPRGLKAAPRMGRYMRNQGLVPDLVLCSAALRAQQTWDMVAEALGHEVPVKSLRSLYMASPARILDIVRRQSDAAAGLLLVGHNPAFAGLVLRLAGPGSDKAALRAAQAKFPTAALAVIEFDRDTWSGLRENGGRLVRFATPKSLG